MPKFKLPPRLPFRRMGIAGLGLIGGSLAKAFSPFDGLEISVFDTDPHTLDEARRIRRFRRVVSDPGEFMAMDIDLAYLCMPVHLNALMLEEMGRLKVPYAVTDAGSTKRAANEAALAAGVNFCGGHPIAGKEVAGFVQSEASLIPGCLYILTPDPRFGPGQKELLGRLRSLHELLGCRIRILSPEEHDSIYSLVSHLPYLAASALAGAAMEGGGGRALEFAGTGFRDTTRVGASPPEKWAAVVMDNAHNLSRDLENLIGVLTRLKASVDARDRDGLLDMLHAFSAYRRTLPEKPVKGKG
ncbi:MAG: prephenate dehydrogenase/arogenate dehydrogenase family protein [Deltaproteobacteria bacterium]|jgi:prephenate dehydrogenase|nr:prephenate dehydrogenase/arogenate dehydrogenase family protein [Deltaproteobacteria bacterium]